MGISSYELISDEYKVTYVNGEIEYIPKRIFENTLVFLVLELDKALTELMKQVYKSLGIYKICKLLNLPIKEKWKL